MSNLDLKLLTIMDELYRTGSVSQTAENLGLNQPAVSMSLARLRKHFNDPLFVKTHHRMEPTRHALSIMPSIKHAHELLRAALEYHDVFDPPTSTRTFRIAGTDIGQVVIVPRLMKRLREAAPQVTVEYSNFSPQSSSQLESGEVDLGIGFISALDAGFHKRKLFRESFVCVARAGHPRVRGALTLEQFQRELHMIVTTSGTAHDIVEKTLEAIGVQRQIGLRVPNYLGLATLISSTDLLVTVPRRLADVVSGLTSVTVFPTPFDIPSYFVTQYWHARFTRDAGNRWLRALVTDEFQDTPSANPRRG